MATLNTYFQLLIFPLFVAQTMKYVSWFGILNFCNAEGECVGHGYEYHEVRDDNGR